MTSLNEIAPRLGQLIRMLSSDQDGEALNAARAIGRTLVGAQLDFHALAEFVESAPAPYSYRPTSSSYRPADRQSTASKPAQQAPKPKAPNPWPTWGTLKRSQQIAWIDAIQDGPHSIDKNTRPEWDALRRKVVCAPHELLTRREINLCNRLIRSSWEKGVRV